MGDDPTADECEDVAKAYDDCAEYHGDEFERQIIARLRASIARLDARDV